MKIYIASFFDTRKRIRPYADTLWAKGHEIVSTWLNEVSKPEMMATEIFRKKLAMKDIAEVNDADLVILDTLDITPRGGREVEFGFALGRFQSKIIYRVGPVRNIFHTLCDNSFDNWDELLDKIPSNINAS